MSGLIRQIAGWFLLFCLAGWAFAFTLDRVLIGGQPLSLLEGYPKSIYADSAHFAAYGLDLLNAGSDQERRIFILGASVPGRAFLPEVLEADLPGWRVHNLSVAGSNVSQMQEIAETLPHPKGNIFVIGGHFISFLENARKFGGPLTTLDKEKLRHHLYAESAFKDGVRPVFPELIQKTLLLALKPVYLAYGLRAKLDGLSGKLRYGLKNAARSLLGKKPSSKPSPETYKKERLAQIGSPSFPDDEFLHLSALTEELTRKGATVVFVEMPLIGFYRDAPDFPVTQAYNDAIKAHGLKNTKDLIYVDLQDFAPDSDFRDDAHPTKDAAQRWSKALAGHLRSEVLEAQ